MIGICNGFQVLTAAGLLPGALGHNARVVSSANGSCSTRCRRVCRVDHGHRRSDRLPDRPRRGPLRAPRPDVARRRRPGRAALSQHNPNGSVDDIAGVCDPSGVVLGLMPHPENHVVAASTRATSGGGGDADLGLHLFDRGVRHAKGLDPDARHASVTAARPPSRRRSAAHRSPRRQGPCRRTRFPTRRRLFVTTDRLSAFDRIIAGVPYKGQVLNQLSWWWFEHTRDIVANHVLSIPDPNVLIAPRRRR